MSEIAVLPNNIKQILERNLGELSTIEGNIISVAEQREIKTMLYTSCNNGEGKTISSVSMAYALSTMTNSKILLIDGNLHNPAIHSLFDIDPEPGLSDLIMKGADYDAVLRESEFKNLYVMPCGSEVLSAPEVYKAECFGEKLNHYKEHFDYVIFDGRSMSSSSGATIIARLFDGVVMVIECEKTRWEVFSTTKEKIEKVGAEILGVVLNKRKYYIPRFLYGKI
ncbi:MAG: CpsD/CapB family tyrosine-protein kinase [Thermodesulfobacteriota bacterium]